MNLATLFGKLQEHELVLSRLLESKEVDKKKKGLALVASTNKTKKDYESMLIQLQ